MEKKEEEGGGKGEIEKLLRLSSSVKEVLFQIQGFRRINEESEVCEMWEEGLFAELRRLEEIKI